MQCDQVFSGEITTSGFRNYYIRAKITTVPYFFHIFPKNVGERGENQTFFPEKNFSGEPPLKLR
jgi:hypothetical protein